MNNIKLIMSKNIKNYWTTLQTNAGKYEQTIFYAMRKALQRNGISTDEWTNEEVVKYFLPASRANLYPWVKVKNKQIDEIDYHGQQQVELSPARQQIVNDILESKISNMAKGQEISGLYAEQSIVNLIEKNLQNKNLQSVAQLGEFLDNQIRQLDFYITLPNDIMDAKNWTNINKNLQQILSNYGIVFDYKPDINNFSVTVAGVDNPLMIDLKNVQSYIANPNVANTDNLIGEILYKKYYAIQPFFYSSKGKVQVLLPKQFFLDKRNFQLNAEREYVPAKQDFVSNGYTEEELREFTEDERKEAEIAVIEQAYQKDILKYFQIKYKRS